MRQRRSRGQRPAKTKETRGQRNVRWIEENCYIPEGKDVGKPVKLRPFQTEFVLDIYDNKAGTRRAILSVGRKNAKTTLAAFLLLLHLAGPEHKFNSKLYSAAQSRDQAGIIFDVAAKCVRFSPSLAPHVQIRETHKELLCPELGTHYKALSAEVKTSFGLSPVFIIHDELGQVRGPKSELYEALETATGAQENPLSIIISTQAPTEADLLSVLIDDAIAAHDKRVVIRLYSAPADCNPFSIDAIQKANPAFGDFQNADEVLAMAEDARRMPSREADYRNLVLNQRVEANNPFVTKALWQSCGDFPAEDFGEVPTFGGLDLSAVNDLTALVLISQQDTRWHVHPTFWLPESGITERSRLDRVPYDVWHKDGYLKLSPGKSVEYEFVAQYLRDVCGDYNVKKIAFDRWGFRHLKPWLLQAGFTDAELASIFVEFGQGYQSMSPALRGLESMLLNGRMAHGNHPVLSMCAANAIVTKDPAGNRKLDKAKSTGRIDGMVALAMAAAVSEAAAEPAAKPKEYQMLFV